MLCAVSVISASDLLGQPTTSLVRHYPDLRALHRALAARDWPGVATFFEALPPEDDRSVAVSMVARLRGVEDFLRTAGGGPAGSTLAATLLAARLITIGWEARGGHSASQVSRARFAVFHDHLHRAERLLDQVRAAEPGNVAAWTSSLLTARGLQMGLAEARRRYEGAARACPHPFAAQLELVQQLCPKWGGSFELAHTFAQGCAEAAPGGALNAVAIAEVHIEQARTESNARRYLRQPQVAEQLRWAAMRSVWHPSYRPVHGWVQAHSNFAYVWGLAGRNREAAPHFAALGNRTTPYPWHYDSGPRLTYKAWQVIVYVTAGWRGEPSRADIPEDSPPSPHRWGQN